VRWSHFSNPLRETEEEIERDVQRIIADQDRQEAEAADFDRIVWAEFERVGGVSMPASAKMPYTHITLTHSTYPGVLYQVTRWDEEGPVGHVDATSKKTALKELLYQTGGVKGWRDRWAAREKL
jgi:hypothetical protein